MKKMIVAPEGARVKPIHAGGCFTPGVDLGGGQYGLPVRVIPGGTHLAEARLGAAKYALSGGTADKHVSQAQRLLDGRKAILVVLGKEVSDLLAQIKTQPSAAQLLSDGEVAAGAALLAASGAPASAPVAPAPATPAAPAARVAPAAYYYAAPGATTPTSGLFPAEIAARVAADRNGNHMVWAAGFPDWKKWDEVPEILALVPPPLAGPPPIPGRPAAPAPATPAPAPAGEAVGEAELEVVLGG